VFGVIDRADSPSLATIVGNNPHSVSLVSGTNGGSWDAVPDSIIPDLGQVSENCSHPEIKQACCVLHDRE
jgi:hypothetical protein